MTYEYQLSFEDDTQAVSVGRIVEALADVPEYGTRGRRVGYRRMRSAAHITPMLPPQPRCLPLPEPHYALLFPGLVPALRSAPDDRMEPEKPLFSRGVGALDSGFHEYIEDFDPTLWNRVVGITRGEQSRWFAKIDETYFQGGSVDEVLSSLRSAFHVIELPCACSPEEAGPADGRAFLVLKTDQWNAQPRPVDRPDLGNPGASFLEIYLVALFSHLLKVCQDTEDAHFQYHEFTSRDVNHRASRAYVSALCVAANKGSRVWRRPAQTLNEGFHVFDELQAQQDLRYEGRVTTGVFLICARERADVVLELHEPVSLADGRRVRKLLEMSDRGRALLTDGIHVYGLAKVPSAPDATGTYLLEFERERSWTLYSDGCWDRSLFRSRDGVGHPPKPTVSREDVLLALKTRFPEISVRGQDALYEVVRKAVEQKHGTAIVISEEAESEADRLSGAATRVRVARLGDGVVEGASGIDGALLFDLEGRCHAVGVILDGVASKGKGEPSRGARYNALLRYVVSGNRQCVAVVVSEDGMIDWLPSKLPA